MWILDSIADVGKMSPVQVAILLEYASTGNKPRKITDIIEALEVRFQGLWEPKKGTIYPSVHNLNIRGYLKLHALRPRGYSLSEKGEEAVHNLVRNMYTQMDLYMRYFHFMIEKFMAINKELAIKTVKRYKEPLKEKVEELEVFLKENPKK